MEKIIGISKKREFFLIILVTASIVVGGFTKTSIMCQTLSRSDVSKKKVGYIYTQYSDRFKSL